MYYKDVPARRKLGIFRCARNDENVNLGVYPESDPENIQQPIPVYLLLNVHFVY